MSLVLLLDTDWKQIKCPSDAKKVKLLIVNINHNLNGWHACFGQDLSGGSADLNY